MFEENANSTDMQNSGQLADLKSSARIIVCLFSKTRSATREFLSAVTSDGFRIDEFVYILPWLQDGGKDTSSWIGSNGEIQGDIVDRYANAIIIDDVNSFDDSIISPFLERIKEIGLSNVDVDVTNLYSYLCLFDALKLYALAARNVLNETGDAQSLTNGTKVWNAMRRINFAGMLANSDNISGTVTMDDRAERSPVYRGFFVSNNSHQILSMVNIESTMLDQRHCNGIMNKSGCYEMAVTDLLRNFWPSIDRKMPKDEPDCGFKGEKCDYTLLYLAAALLSLFIMLAIGSYSTHIVCQKRSLDKLSFRIFRDDLQIIDKEQVKSMLSLNSTRTKLSNVIYGIENHAMVGTNTHSIYHKFTQLRSIAFNKTDKQLLSCMKQAIHDNVNPFLGISFNEKEEVLLIWKFCSRGTLQDIIYNDRIALNDKFHGAFIRDILSGLEYLHNSKIGYHGSLSTSSCLIDRNWMVKLTDYGIADPLERWEKEQTIQIQRENPKEDEEKSQNTNHQVSSVLYEAPEIWKNREKNRLRRVDQEWIRQSLVICQLGDIYAFGIVIHEIIFRSLPFPENIDMNVVIEQIKNGSGTIKPSIQPNNVMALSTLMSDCWNSNPEKRPSLRRIKLNMESFLNIKGSLVDQMMQTMEQYANNLEKLVQERTGMLEEANIRADKLLSQLLPAYVANELKLGHPIPPKTISSATVLFSDIVGFTEMCMNATPHEVITVLNGVFDGFDQIIARRDAYKVETIGDAYMVVSGVPEENGHRHINEIAYIAIGVHKFLADFRITNRPDIRVSCRLGFHTGPVASAVVGLTAPRFCLFGDTVNMSSRMETNGEAGMTQISEAAEKLLKTEYSEYITQFRGEIEVKGKGLCKTYWLVGTQDDLSNETYKTPTSITAKSNFEHFLGDSQQRCQLARGKSRAA